MHNKIGIATTTRSILLNTMKFVFSRCCVITRVLEVNPQKRDKSLSSLATELDATVPNCLLFLGFFPQNFCLPQQENYSPLNKSIMIGWL